MTKREFHNALRILLNIDRDEWEAAVYPADATDHLEVATQWYYFRDNPHAWFIRAPDAAADAVWKIVESRQPTTRPADGTVTITTPRTVASLAASILAGSRGQWAWFGGTRVGPEPNLIRLVTDEELEAVSAFVKQLEES